MLLWKLYHPIKIFTRALLNFLSVMWNRRFCRFHIIQNFLWVYDNISRKKIQQKCPETLFLRVNSLLLGTANKPIQKSAYEKIISSSLSALIAWIKRSPFLCLMRRKFCALARYITVGKAFSLKFSILAPNAMRRVLFRFLWKRLTNPHTGFNRSVLRWWLHVGTEILKGIGRNQIIVLIVLIGTDAWMKQCPFLCLMRRKFWAFRSVKISLSYSSSLSSLSALSAWMKHSLFFD